MNIQEKTKTFEIVPKRHALKTQDYNNAALINWVDFRSVRGDFSYARSNERHRISASILQVA